MWNGSLACKKENLAWSCSFLMRVSKSGPLRATKVAVLSMIVLSSSGGSSEIASEIALSSSEPARLSSTEAARFRGGADPMVPSMPMHMPKAIGT